MGEMCFVYRKNKRVATEVQWTMKYIVILNICQNILLFFKFPSALFVPSVSSWWEAFGAVAAQHLSRTFASIPWHSLHAVCCTRLWGDSCFPHPLWPGGTILFLWPKSGSHAFPMISWKVPHLAYCRLLNTLVRWQTGCITLDNHFKQWINLLWQCVTSMWIVC